MMTIDQLRDLQRTGRVDRVTRDAAERLRLEHLIEQGTAWQGRSRGSPHGQRIVSPVVALAGADGPAPRSAPTRDGARDAPSLGGGGAGRRGGGVLPDASFVRGFLTAVVSMVPEIAPFLAHLDADALLRCDFPSVVAATRLQLRSLRGRRAAHCVAIIEAHADCMKGPCGTPAEREPGEADKGPRGTPAERASGEADALAAPVRPPTASRAPRPDVGEAMRRRKKPRVYPCEGAAPLPNRHEDDGRLHVAGILLGLKGT